MLGINSLVAIFLFGSHGLRASTLRQSQKLANSERSKIVFAGAALSPRDESSYSSSIGQTSVSQFMSSWEILTQSFSQCQSVFAQHSSIAVATQSVQHLYSSYQKSVEQYNSCSACAASLRYSNYETQIQQSVAVMYSSFNSIMITGQENFGAEWQTHFASTFQSMSQFSSFSQQVCSSAGVDLSGTLSHLGLNGGLFEKLGISLDGILGTSGRGILDNVLNVVGGGSGDHDDGHGSGSLLAGIL